MKTQLAPNANKPPKPADYEPPKLAGWNEFTRELTNVPMAVAAAISAGRPELLRAMLARKPNAPPTQQVTDDEVKSLIELAIVLIETNQELQRHCAVLADKMGHVRNNLHAVNVGLDQLDAWANFQPHSRDDEE
jgi:hypothetical protein